VGNLSYLRNPVPLTKAVWPVKPLRAAHPGSGDTGVPWYSPKVGVGKICPKKEIGIPENKKTPFGLEVSVI
jgi:hypothetical protein